MKNKFLVGSALAIGGLILLRPFKNKPRKAEPVKDFDLNKYLGNWYEIARFDHRFEKHLDNVMAQYGLNDDGTIKVINSGYHKQKEKWEKAEGVAKFRGAKNIGALKVSFFGAIYEGYNVLAVDDDYNHALVAGRNLNYLWILSRQKILPQNIKDKYTKLAELIGYNIKNLIWVNHDAVSPFDQELT